MLKNQPLTEDNMHYCRKCLCVTFTIHKITDVEGKYAKDKELQLTVCANCKNVVCVVDSEK